MYIYKNAVKSTLSWIRTDIVGVVIAALNTLAEKQAQMLEDIALGIA